MASPVIIYGPTATGKTELAIIIAKKINGEIISADSRQVYKRLDIGTGKVSFASKIEKHKGYWIVNGIKIHGFDLVNPTGYEPGSHSGFPKHEPGSRLETFTVADFIKFAATTMIRIIVSKQLPIIVGGTGFYIKTLIEGLESIGIPKNPQLRKKLEKLTKDELFKKLKVINPQRAKALNQSDRQNPRRLIRAIEISMSSGKSLQTTDHQLQTKNYQIFGLNAPNEFLYEKADGSLDKRLKNGLIEEVEALIKSGVSSTWLESLGLEYRWITRYITGSIGKEKAINRLKGDLHDFIRRQKTWFSKFPDIVIFDVSQKNWQKKVEDRIFKYLRN